MLCRRSPLALGPPPVLDTPLGSDTLCFPALCAVGVVDRGKEAAAFASEIRVCLFWRSRGGHDAPPDMVEQKFQKTKIIGKRHSLSAVESPTPARGRSLFMADMGYMLSGTLCHAGRRRYCY